MERNRKVTATEVAAALADPLRFQILGQLLDGPVNVAELVAAAGASQPNVSNHLAVLRRRGLVTTERRGRQVVYRLAEPSVAQVVEALSSLAAPRSKPAVPADWAPFTEMDLNEASSRLRRLAGIYASRLRSVGPDAWDTEAEGDWSLRRHAEHCALSLTWYAAQPSGRAVPMPD